MMNQTNTGNRSPKKHHRPATDEVLPLMNSIFVGSFNMNNEDLSYNDAASWLQEAKHADLVVLAMQECGSCRLDGSMPLPENQEQQDSWCRKPQLDRSDTLLHSIQDALNDGYKIVADVAMGESATGRKVAIDGEPDTEWYGYIRMIVPARTELADKLSRQCRTLVCPVGSKPSVDSLTSQLPDYPVDASPDKGAVCVALGSDLWLVNVHLAGTNQYNVNEEHFDEIRKYQLTRIHEMCQPYGHCIVAGDFNFRCEIHPNEKSRGGLDFQAVHEIVKSADCEAIGNLYRKHDRLIQLVNSNDNTRYF